MKYILAFLIIILSYLAYNPHFDVEVSSYFFNKDGDNSFSYRNTLFSIIIYKSVRVFTTLILGISMFVIFYDFIKSKAILKLFHRIFFDKFRDFIKLSKRQAIFIFSVIIITPGIIVHWLGKPIWNRARPVNIKEFGGDKDFTAFYQTFTDGAGNSFPSGHAAMSFAFLALIYIFPEGKRKAVALTSFTYAIIGSLCRVWQGGHFLSDVVASGLLTVLTIIICKKYMLSEDAKGAK